MPQHCDPKLVMGCSMAPELSSASPGPLTAAQRDRRACISNRWSMSMATLVLILSNSSNSYVECLLMPPRRIAHYGAHNGKADFLPHRQQHPTSKSPHSRVSDGDGKTSKTSLHLFFDKFLHPYGVSPANNTNGNENDDLDQSSVELLEALLPRLQTKEERLEGFQRRLLDEQIRLSKLSKNASGGNNNDIDDDDQAHFLADDEDEVSRMSDIFQQARLAEQIRLSKSKDMLGTGHHLDEENEGGVLGNDYDKYEAFQRALLEERLKIRKLQQQRQKFLSTSEAIEHAMMEYENETMEEQKTLQMTMVQERDTENSNDTGSTGEESSVLGDSVIMSSTSTNNNGDGNIKDMFENKPPVNQTENVPSKQLSEKLESLHQMVTVATTSSSTANGVALSTVATSKNTTFSLQNFVSTTHLPLPPKEDASLFSLALAPIVHLFTSMFLLGAAGFYAILAVLDVIWNDNKGQYSTRACLREATAVCRGCWGYVFPSAGTEVKERVVQRTLQASKTAIIASFYALQCILMRAAKHSRHATLGMEAGTGALRYMVYTLRSANIFGVRLLASVTKYIQKRVGSDDRKLEIASENTNTVRRPWKQKLTPLRALSSIKSLAKKRFQKQGTLYPVGEQFRSDEMYNKKLRLLNLDRVALERDRQVLQEERRQLELERTKLLSEGVNNLAWYSAASEAAAAAVQRKEENVAQEKKKHWNLWRKKEDGEG